MDRTCPKCAREFAQPCVLKKHLARKTPCEPIVATGNQKARDHVCRYCQRGFATRISMYRHIRQNCKIANSDEGMDRLMDHTLQKQIAAMNESMSIMSTKLDELMKGQQRPPAQTAAAVVHNALVVNNHVQINIRSWASIEDRLLIPASMLRAAFTENQLLADYCRMGYEAKTDPEKAAPYVLEALTDLVRRAHADPLARNVYLNPKRADQVLVLDEASWKVISLPDAIRGLFDSVAGKIREISRSNEGRAELGAAVEDAAAFVPTMYQDEPDRYVKGGRGAMAAHLRNTTPQLEGGKK